MHSMAARVYGWLDERLDLATGRELLRSKTVPVHRYTVLYLLGGATLFFFGVQVTTGVLLMLYYRPSAQEAFESVEFIMTAVPYGWLVRSVHAWSANLMIFFAFVHLVTVFFMKAYRKPRELTWVSGCALLFLLLGFGFSGYLLPWNQVAFFATKVGAGVALWTPVAGDWIHRLLLGGDRVGAATLLRFYTLHVFVLPMLTLGLIALHLHLVQHHGVSVPPRITAKKPAVPFFPNFFFRDLLCWLVSLGALLALASFYPADLGEKADPFASAQENIRPEWYFMFMFQSLRMMPPGEIAGIAFEAVPFFLSNLGALLLLAVPFLDRGKDGSRGSTHMTVAGIVVLSYIVGMTAWGYRSLMPLALAAATVLGVLLLIYATGGRRERPDG